MHWLHLFISHSHIQNINKRWADKISKNAIIRHFSCQLLLVRPGLVPLPRRGRALAYPASPLVGLHNLIDFWWGAACRKSDFVIKKQTSCKHFPAYIEATSLRKEATYLGIKLWVQKILGAIHFSTTNRSHAVWMQRIFWDQVKKVSFCLFLLQFCLCNFNKYIKVGWSVIFAFKDFWAKWVFSAFCFLGRRLPFPQINCFATRLNCNRGWRTHSQTWEKCRKCEMQTLRNAENASSRWSCKLWAMKLSSHPPTH